MLMRLICFTSLCMLVAWVVRALFEAMTWPMFTTETREKEGRSVERKGVRCMILVGLRKA